MKIKKKLKQANLKNYHTKILQQRHIVPVYVWMDLNLDMEDFPSSFQYDLG